MGWDGVGWDGRSLGWGGVGNRSAARVGEGWAGWGVEGVVWWGGWDLRGMEWDGHHEGVAGWGGAVVVWGGGTGVGWGGVRAMHL